MVPGTNLIIVAVMWLVFAGGLWAYYSRKRDGLRVEFADWLTCWAAVIILGKILLDMLAQAMMEGIDYGP